MRFLYEYRTSDNAKHCGVICAADREVAYAELKKHGVRPCRFVEAPGFFNKLFGKGKRWLAIGLLSLSLIVALLFIDRPQPPVLAPRAPSLPRHQIASLPKDWTSCIDSVFSDEVERMLALYSQPGVAVERPAAGERREITDADRPWVDVLRQVVAGMRDDANGYIKLGKSLDELERFLAERQRMEAAYREQLIRQLKSGVMTKVDVNAALSAVGMKIAE